MAEVEIIGLNALLVTLNEVTDDIGRKVGDLIQQAGQECQAEAKGHAPVDTGRLRDSITYEATGDLEATVSTDVPYSTFVELGTYKMAPRPYMLPAFEIAKSHLEGELRNL